MKTDEHDLGDLKLPRLRQAPDGEWYLPDPHRPGKYLRILGNG